MKALRVALQTKIQYNLVQNQVEGIGTKTKDLLSMFVVTMKDGTVERMDTPAGMIYLCRQLENPSDNNVMLNLFLQQSGLSEFAVKSMCQNFDVEKTKELLDEQAELVKTYLNDINVVESAIKEYFDKTKMLKMDFKTYVNGLINHVKRYTADIEDSVVVDDVIKILSQVDVRKDAGAITPSIMPTVVTNIVDSVLNDVSAKINEQISYIDYLANFVAEECKLLWSIDIPQDCETAGIREELQKKANEVFEYKQAVTAQLNEIVLQNEELRRKK